MIMINRSCLCNSKICFGDPSSFFFSSGSIHIHGGLAPGPDGAVPLLHRCGWDAARWSTASGHSHQAMPRRHAMTPGGTGGDGCLRDHQIHPDTSRFTWSTWGKSDWVKVKSAVWRGKSTNYFCGHSCNSSTFLGRHTGNHGKPKNHQVLVGKSTISMAMFNSKL